MTSVFSWQSSAPTTDAEEAEVDQFYEVGVIPQLSYFYIKVIWYMQMFGIIFFKNWQFTK